MCTRRLSQVPGIDFSENYSPHSGFLAKIVNVETAFLHRDKEEEIYKECPQGMFNIGKDAASL